MKMNHRRKFIKKASMLSMASVFTTRFLFPESRELRIGYLPITDATPLLIAHANGYFKDEGLNVDFPIRVRAWSTLAESFMTHKFNLTHMLLPMPIWMRFSSNVPIKILAWNHTNGSAITIRKDSGIRDFSDLGGKQIAVPYWYSIHNVILQMGIRKAGLLPVIKNQSGKLKKNEVNLFILSPSEMPASLMGRKIDGYIVAEPFNALGEMRVGARIMRFTGDIWKNHPCCVIVMNQRLISEKPVFVQKVINAVVRAQAWINTNPRKTAAILSREGKNYLPIPRRVLEKVFTDYSQDYYGDQNLPKAIRNPQWEIGRIGFQPFPYPSATEFIIQKLQRTLVEGQSAFLKKLDPRQAELELVDKRFVKKAISGLDKKNIFPHQELGGEWKRLEVIDL